jgi:hypothetical protein
MATSKRKKMFLIILLSYFVIIIAIYFAMGGFYFSRSAKDSQEYGKRLTNEFVSVSSDQVLKGIYAGETDYLGKKHYQIQFPGLLIGPNRYLNIYYGLNEDDYPYVVESAEKLEGKPAYLILNPYGYYGGDNVSYDKVFGQDTLINPKEFLDTINEEIAKAPDTLFVTALTVMENELQVQMMMWTKEADSTYNAKRFSDLKYAWANTGNCKINLVQRNSSGNGIKLLGAGILDIITAPIQGIIVSFYLIMAMLIGPGAK